MAKKLYSFIRPKLQELNLTIDDYEFISSPFDYAFEFDKGEGIVRIESAYDILPQDAQRELKRFLSQSYLVKRGSCHETAFRVGDLLENYGVMIADGWYTNCNNETYLHTYCKYGNHYFDPTIETVYGFNRTKMYAYQSDRVFTPHEMQLYYHACGYDQEESLDTLYFTSSIGINEKNPKDSFSLYYIDDNGYLHRTITL